METLERLLSGERHGWPGDDEVTAAMPEVWQQRRSDGELKRNRERDEFLEKLREIRKD